MTTQVGVLAIALFAGLILLAIPFALIGRELWSGTARDPGYIILLVACTVLALGVGYALWTGL